MDYQVVCPHCLRETSVKVCKHCGYSQEVPEEISRERLIMLERECAHC